jgi:hypothetical protein
LSSIRAAIKTGRDFPVNTRLAIPIHYDPLSSVALSQLESSIAALTPRAEGRELFRTTGDADFADALRAATNGGWALGDARFKRQIAKALDRQGSRSSRLWIVKALSRRVAPLPKGRPPRRKPDRRQLNLLWPHFPLEISLDRDRRTHRGES